MPHTFNLKTATHNMSYQHNTNNHSANTVYCTELYRDELSAVHNKLQAAKKELASLMSNRGNLDDNAIADAQLQVIICEAAYNEIRKSQ